MVNLDEFPYASDIPDDMMKQVEKFVYDLAYGVLNRDWHSRLNFRNELQPGEDGKQYQKWVPGIPMEDITPYINKIWRSKGIYEPHIGLLYSLGYVTEESPASGDLLRCSLTKAAFDLLKKPPQQIFISYSHQASSAVAMFIRSELLREGYAPFIDIYDISSGETLKLALENRIRSCDVFIVVIGQRWEKQDLLTTFNSEGVKAEIELALKYNTNKIIPVLHGGIIFDELKHYPLFSDLSNQYAVVVERETSQHLATAISKIISALRV